MKIQAVRGMQDLLPGKMEIFRHIEDVARRVIGGYGYREVGLPVIESTALFKRAVGEATDIVEKEMYTFDDRSGDSLTLRPEGTAGLVRLANEHGLAYNQVQRLWYIGPMFRYERPQKGRYRQFEQIGCECLGMAGPDIDAELLLMLNRLWEALGISGDVALELNTMGTAEARAVYRKDLVDYLLNHRDALDEDSQRRLTTNPLRILDSKSASTQAVLEGAPVLMDYIDDESKVHFDTLRRTLDRQQVPYVVNPKIVRGLDYYSRTVFEWITDTLGAQGTVCGGGRYDGLVEQVGGRATPGVGFAMGLDRLALMLEPTFENAVEADIYVASVGETARAEALLLAESLRGALDCRVITHCGDGKFKAQMKKADASGARIALILGEDEIARGEVTLKRLATGEQESIESSRLADVLGGYLKE